MCSSRLHREKKKKKNLPADALKCVQKRALKIIKRNSEQHPDLLVWRDQTIVTLRTTVMFQTDHQLYRLPPIKSEGKKQPDFKTRTSGFNNPTISIGIKVFNIS